MKIEELKDGDLIYCEDCDCDRCIVKLEILKSRPYPLYRFIIIKHKDVNPRTLTQLCPRVEIALKDGTAYLI